MKALEIPGVMETSAVKVLYEWASQLPDNAVLVEVGSLFGRSSVCWADGSPTTQIHCFDKWSGFLAPGSWVLKYDEAYRREHNMPDPFSYKVTTETFKSFTQDFPNIHPHQVPGGDADVTWDGTPIDACWIDASHLNPSDLNYIKFFLPFMNVGGWIGGHDYIPDVFPDVVENAKFLADLFETDIELADGYMWRVRVTHSNFAPIF